MELGSLSLDSVDSFSQDLPLDWNNMAAASKRASRTMKIALAFITISLHWSNVCGLAQNQGEISSQSLVTAASAQSKTSEPATNTNYSQELFVRHDNRRPIWALAHMVNSIKELDYRLSTGANAIEVDVTFGPDGDPLWTYHGPPCDCWRHCYQREDFHDFLNYVREIAIDTPSGAGQNLSILFLDLKLDPLDQYGKVRAGQELAKAVMSDIYLETHRKTHTQVKPFHLILSINHVNDIDLVNNFLHTLEINNSSHLMRHIGFDVGMNDDLTLIESMWHKFAGTLNLWQGDGYTNCFSPFYNLHRLSSAVGKRDSHLGYPAKVYHWTIDLHDRMRESLLLGVDAIMSNHPERLLTVLQEPEIAHDFRLATRDDSPFRKLPRRGAGRSGETARFQRSANSNTGGLLGNLMDIFSSWCNYIREIPLLSLPTTILKSGHKRARPSNLTKHSITPVKLTSFTEYKVENVSSIMTSDILDPVERSSGIQGGLSSDQKLELEYQPTWYVSLVSNLLVSALRSILPG